MFNKNELILPSAYALEGRGINPGTQQTTILKLECRARFKLAWGCYPLQGCKLLPSITRPTTHWFPHSVTLRIFHFTKVV